MSHVRFLAVLTASLLAAAPAAAQEADTTIVAPRFDWKPGTTARVEASRVRVRATGEDADTVRIGSRYTMRVEAHPEGRLIRFSGFQLGPTSSGVGDAAAAVQQVAAGAVPAYVVSAEGEFLRVDDISRVKAQLDTLLSSLLGEARDSLPAGLRQMLDSFTSEEVLNALAAQDWNAMVGMWVDAEFQEGMEYDAESEEPNPLDPGTTVRMRYTFALNGRVPCREDDARADCVELEMVSEPDSATFQAFMKRFIGQLGFPAAQVEEFLKDAAVRNSVVVVMDPRTMLPHWLESARSIRMVTPGENGGGPIPTVQTDVRVYEWTYEN